MDRVDEVDGTKAKDRQVISAQWLPKPATRWVAPNETIASRFVVPDRRGEGVIRVPVFDSFLIGRNVE